MKPSDSASPIFSQEGRRLLDKLNKDERIGPYAGQDGDLVQWWLGATAIALYDCLIIMRDGDFSGLENATEHEVALWRAEADRPSKTSGLIEFLKVQGRELFLKACPKPSTAALALWERFYSLVTAELKEHWGGRSVRIRKNTRPARDPVEVIKAGLKAGRPIAEIFKIAGVSRSTGYRILGRPQ